MKKPLLLTASLAIFAMLAPSNAFAEKALGPKGKLFAKYDTNKNGVIDGDEIAAMQKDYAADPQGDLKRYDKNNDGKLDAQEIAAIKPPGSGAKKGGEKKEKTKSSEAASTDSKAAADKSADPKPAEASKDNPK